MQSKKFPGQQTVQTRNGIISQPQNTNVSPLPAPSTAPPRGNISHFNAHSQQRYGPRYVPVQQQQGSPNFVYLHRPPYGYSPYPQAPMLGMRTDATKAQNLYGGYPMSSGSHGVAILPERPVYHSAQVKEKRILSVVNPSTKEEVNIKREPTNNKPNITLKAPVTKDEIDSKTAVKNEFYQQVLNKLKSDAKKDTVSRKNDAVIAKKDAVIAKKETVIEKVLEPVKTKETALNPPESIKISIPSSKNNGKRSYSIQDLERAKEYFKEYPEVLKLKDLNWNQIACDNSNTRSRGSAFSSKNKHNSSRQHGNPKWNRSNKSVRVTTSIPVEVTLHQAENAWKPLSQNQKLTAHEKILSETKSMLNKLSKENFDKLSLSFASLSMPSLLTYRVFINLIREKALLEPSFADMYAELCAILENRFKKGAPKSFSKTFPFFEIVKRDNRYYWSTGLTAAPEDIIEKNPYIPSREQVKEFGPFDDLQACEKSATETLQFKRFVLFLCQRQFDEKDRFTAVRTMQKVLKAKISNLKNQPEEEKALIESQIELNEVKTKEKGIKRSMIANFNFIGELYLQNLISNGIISYCLSRLGNIKPDVEQIIPEPENLECLCKLLTIIGKKFDEKTNANYLPVLFKAIKVFSESPELDNRHRFMCVDILDLKAKGWKGKDTRSKTKEEVRSEARAEEAKQRASMNNFSSKSNTSRPKFKRSNGTNNYQSNSAQGTSSINASKLGMRPRGGTKTVSVMKKVSLEKPEKDKIRSKAKSALREFGNGSPPAEVVLYLTDDLNKIPHLKLPLKSETVSVFLEGTLNIVVDGTDQQRAVVAKFIKVLCGTGEVKNEDIVKVLLTMSSTLEDIQIDVPKAGEYFGSVLFELLNENCLSQQNVKQTLNTVKKASSSMFKKVYKSFNNLATKSSLNITPGLKNLDQ